SLISKLDAISRTTACNSTLPGIDLVEIMKLPIAVVYFSLPPAADTEVARAIGRWALSDTLLLARTDQTPRGPITIVAEEFGELLNSEIATDIRQSRDSGVALWLNHQSAADLKNAEVDVSSIVY